MRIALFALATSASLTFAAPARAIDPLTGLSMALQALDFAMSSSADQSVESRLDSIDRRLTAILDGAESLREIVRDELQRDRYLAYQIRIRGLRSRLEDAAAMCSAQSAFCDEEYRIIMRDAREAASELQSIDADPLSITLVRMIQPIQFEAMRRAGAAPNDAALVWSGFRRYYGAQLSPDAPQSAAARFRALAVEQGQAYGAEFDERFDRPVTASWRDLSAVRPWLADQLAERTQWVGDASVGGDSEVVGCLFYEFTDVFADAWRTRDETPRGRSVGLYTLSVTSRLTTYGGAPRLAVSSRVSRSEGVYPSSFRSREDLWRADGGTRCIHAYGGGVDNLSNMREGLAEYARDAERAVNVNIQELRRLHFVLAEAFAGLEAGPGDFVLPASQRVDFNDLVQFNQTRFVGVSFFDMGEGLAITEVADDGPAAAAGLAPNDTILAINDAPAENTTALLRAVQTYSGAPIRLRVNRNGAARDLEVTPMRVLDPIID